MSPALKSAIRLADVEGRIDALDCAAKCLRQAAEGAERAVARRALLRIPMVGERVADEIEAGAIIPAPARCTCPCGPERFWPETYPAEPCHHCGRAP